MLGAEPRVRTQVVLARLAEHNPTEYESWTFTDLRLALAAYGIKPGKSAGVMVVRADEVTNALAHRATTLDTDGDGEADRKEGS